MKKVWSIAFITVLAVVLSDAAPFASEQASRMIIGVLSYTPAPDMAVCFCGSFLLTADDARSERYLFSDAIDLREYDGLKILVTGKAFTTFCSGTLERPCSCIDVEKVIVFSRVGVEGVDWGAVKMIYR
jgi:hypothetical protein